MTVAQLEQLVWTKLNDSTGTYYPQALGALNEAQRLFALLSLCLETSATFTLAAGTLGYNVLTQIPGFILPQRTYNSAGEQLRPSTVAELEALDANWMSTPGLPQRYVFRGLDFLMVYPQPAAADTLVIAHSRCPAMLAANGDVPEIRAASQYALANYAAWALRQPEGGQEFAKFAGYLKEFMAEAKKVGDLVRERNKDKGFETVGPYELRVVK
jgi:hypothetical protein